ncbi:MAG: dTDP-4-dehydrorhamnose 3,5-epimerase [Anaerolineales bacterium]|nr:dTDP-4-dehydrorhamnose 3,5-epimerase [Anaerolineales bacterium]
MEFKPTTLPEVILISPVVYGDERGFFMETYREIEFSAAGIPGNFVQDNHSGSVQGTLRGLHYQIKQSQGKLVQVVSGEVFDVAVDLRKSSPTFGKWAGELLSAGNKHQLWIPPGFAHGFYVLSDWANVIYKVTDYYAPEWDRTLLWNDPEIGIDWPLIGGEEVNISTKDANGLRLRDAETFV